MKLVVNNAPQPEAVVAQTEAELRGLAQTALVTAAKHQPLRVIVIAAFEDGEVGVWTSGLTRDGARNLSGIGVKTMLAGLE